MIIKPLGKQVWNDTQTLNIFILIDSAIPFLGLCPKEIIRNEDNDLCTKIFTMSLFMAANSWKQPKCPAMNDYPFLSAAIRIKNKQLF